RFVIESAGSDSATDSATATNESGENSGLTDKAETLSLDRAQAPETQEAAADGSAPSAEPGGKFKRKKKQADKPVLATKPGEAVGVTKFKTKKRLAEAKLESSKVNLSRVNDIVVEVEKQLGSLKRQAAKARRYSEIRDQMRSIVRQMLAGKARELDAEAERVS